MTATKLIYFIQTDSAMLRRWMRLSLEQRRKFADFCGGLTHYREIKTAFKDWRKAERNARKAKARIGANTF